MGSAAAARETLRSQAGCAAHLPSPRVHIYELPHKLVTWPPPMWRHVRALWTWIKASRYNEPKPLCADYFLVPSYPNNHDDTGHDVGDLRMMQLFDYIRMRWPAFNHSIRSGRPNHFMLLPCDHGPGDCAFSRPLKPNKYRRYRDGLGLSNMPFRAPDGWRAGGWIDLWEAINPASPARALILLGYSGWSDQLRRSDGSCLNCYQSGLDVRMPTPEGHECGPLCGMHFAFNETLSQNIFLPVELQRLMLLGDAKKSSALVALGPSRRQGTRPKSRCFFSWAGAVRGRNNPSRSKLLQLRNISGMCITNTIEKEQQREQERQKRIREGLELPPVKGKSGGGPREKDEKKPSISDVMLHSRFCFSPLGWDQGDSDR